MTSPKKQEVEVLAVQRRRRWTAAEMYLAGMIHALEASGHACTGSKASIREIIALWRVDLARDPDRLEVRQAESLLQTLRDHGLTRPVSNGGRDRALAR